MKLIFLIILPAFSSLLTTNVEGINGGTKAHLGQFKYLVGIDVIKSGLFPMGFFDDIYICGGAIIAEKYILSAAHCFADQTNNQDYRFVFKKHRVIVYANTLSLDKEYLKQHHVITRTVAHAYFVPKFFENGVADIVVLELDENLHIQKNNLEILHLPKPILNGAFDYYYNANVTLMGYGKDAEGNTDNLLKYMQAKVVDIDKCNVFVGGADRERFICAEGVKDPLAGCIGDSGSPLVYEVQHKNTMETYKIVIGIMSLGCGCLKHEKLPNLLPRVSLYKNFITDSMHWTRNTHLVVKHSYFN